MDRNRLKDILSEVQNGDITLDDAMGKLKNFDLDDMGYAVLDLHRELRRGFPEAIYGEGKTTEQLKGILERLMIQTDANIIATRCKKEAYQEIKETIPEAEYHEAARMITVKRKATDRTGSILVVCAGTSDLGVAEEAALTAEMMGNKVDRLYDVGVAGLHRLLSAKDKLVNSRVIIVVAGMEGALASVIGGLVDKPVIAVPTSVGYGASFRGIAALLSMLNSCSSGVTVVNIDNGFGAAYAAAVMNQM